MEKLLKFINRLDKAARLDFCKRCGTSERYLRKAISIRQRLGADLCINIERESSGDVECEDLRPDVDWAYLRGTVKRQRREFPDV